jgi:RNA polymerase sigma-70 factor (sigma-E family)
VDLLRTQWARAEFEGFVSSHGEWLLRTAYLITWDLAEAEDLVQECLLRLARRWPRVRRMAHPEAYARRILVNLTFDGAHGRRRRKVELERPNGVPHDHPNSHSLPPPTPFEDRSELVGALGALPQRQRLMLVLRYFADLSEEQTAQALGCSLGTVKSTTSRALARVRETMNEVTPSQQGGERETTHALEGPSRTTKEAAHDPAT